MLLVRGRLKLVFDAEPASSFGRVMVSGRRRLKLVFDAEPASSGACEKPDAGANRLKLVFDAEPASTSYPANQAPW